MRAVIQNTKHQKCSDQTQKLNKVQPKKGSSQKQSTNQKVSSKPGITHLKTGMTGRWSRETPEHEGKTEPTEVTRQTDQDRGDRDTDLNRQGLIINKCKPDLCYPNKVVCLI